MADHTQELSRNLLWRRVCTATGVKIEGGMGARQQHGVMALLFCNQVKQIWKYQASEQKGKVFSF